MGIFDIFTGLLGVSKLQRANNMYNSKQVTVPHTMAITHNSPRNMNRTNMNRTNMNRTNVNRTNVNRTNVNRTNKINTNTNKPNNNTPQMNNSNMMQYGGKKTRKNIKNKNTNKNKK